MEVHSIFILEFTSLSGPVNYITTGKKKDQNYKTCSADLIFKRSLWTKYDSEVVNNSICNNTVEKVL